MALLPKDRGVPISVGGQEIAGEWSDICRQPICRNTPIFLVFLSHGWGVKSRKPMRDGNINQKIIFSYYCHIIVLRE